MLKAHAHSTREHLENEAVRYLNKKHRDCHTVFKTSTYEQFNNINPCRVDQACQWALSHPLYQRWRDSAIDDLLWISADPGCGKSVLSKSLVNEELRSGANDSTVCYFFFKDNDEQNSLATGLCALLHQLFQQQPHLLQHAIPAWNQNGSKLQQETDELWRILLTATSDPFARNTTCVLDALDECRDRDRSDLIAKIARFHEDAVSQGPRQSWLKFIVTSRPYDDIRRGFGQRPSSLPAIRLRGEQQNDEIRAEINRVINVRVSHMATELGLRESTSSRLEQTLLAMEHRTYLWLHLAIGDIRTTLRHSFKPDEEAIESIPLSVEGAYEKILARVIPAQHQKVKLILQIIVGARRPLSVGEMALALGLATTKQCRTSMDAQLDTVHLGKQLRHWCGLFVFVNQSRIYLTHQTAREFLVARQNNEHSKAFTHNTWRHCLQQIETEQMMTSICIRCLNLEDRKVPADDKFPTDDDLSTKAGESRKEFIEYCCEWWTIHYRLSQNASGDDNLGDAVTLYDTKGEVFEFWFNKFWIKTRRHDAANDITPIRLAALSDHDKVLGHFLDLVENNVHAKEEAGRSALYWASELGHGKIVSMLVDAGADVNAQGGEYDNALQAASAEGHDEIVQMLLKHLAVVDAETFILCLRKARIGEILTLLPHVTASCVAQTGKDHSKTPLHWAAELGAETVVERCLNLGVNVNVRDRFGELALHYAAESGHLSIVEALVKANSDRDLVNVHGRTPLECAKGAGPGEGRKPHLAVINYLLS